MRCKAAWVLLAFMTLAVLTAACECPESPAAAQARIDAESARVRPEIEARGAAFVNRYEAKDVDGVAALFTVDAHLIPPGTKPLVGRAAIRDHIAQGLSLGEWSSAITTESVVANGPLAVERGRYVLTFTPDASSPPGMRPFQQAGNYLIHWRREDGEWRMATYIGQVEGAPVVE